MDSEKSPDARLITEIAGKIDSAARIAGDANDVLDLLDLPEGESPLRVVALAFQYVEAIPQRGRYQGSYFGPSVSLGDGSEYPPPFERLPASASTLIESVAEMVTEPIARARLNDISFEAGWGRRGIHASSAIEGYLAVASRDLTGLGSDRRLRADLSTVKSLARAVDLARRTKQANHAETAIAAARSAAEAALDGGTAGPGVVLGLIGILVGARVPHQLIAPLLERARTRYENQPFLAVSTIELQLAMEGLSPEERDRFRRELVGVWMREAERNGGITRMVHLETAVKIARKFGFGDLIGEATAALQAIDADELGLVRRSYPITIPQEAVDEYLGHITNAPTWQEALGRLLHGGPPSGAVASNRAAVAAAASVAPLQALVPRTRLGGDGLPRFTASSQDDREEWQLTEHEMLNARVQAPIDAEALRRIWQKWGPISEEDFADFLEGPQTQPALARALARAFLRHFNGDPEGAAYSAAPRVEALARAITLAIPLPIYRTQRERTPGQYPGLGALMPALIEAGLDESWGRYISSLLSSPMGANLRNEMMHGFEADIEEPVAVLVLIAALYLAVGVQLRETTSNETGDDSSQSSG